MNLHQLWMWSQHHWQAEGSPLLVAYQEQLHPGVSSGMCPFSLPKCRWRWPAAIWHSSNMMQHLDDIHGHTKYTQILQAKIHKLQYGQKQTFISKQQYRLYKTCTLISIDLSILNLLWVYSHATLVLHYIANECKCSLHWCRSPRLLVGQVFM